MIKVTHTHLSHCKTHSLYSHVTVPPRNEGLENPGQINKHYIGAVLPNLKSRKDKESPSFRCKVLNDYFIFLSLTLQLNINPIQFLGMATTAFSQQHWFLNMREHSHQEGEDSACSCTNCWAAPSPRQPREDPYLGSQLLVNSAPQFQWIPPITHFNIHTVRRFLLLSNLHSTF